MDWIQVLTILGGNLAIFLWVRTEANADRREIHAAQRQDRQELLEIIRAIKDDMKDFHGKLERQDAEFKAHLMYHHDKQ